MMRRRGLLVWKRLFLLPIRLEVEDAQRERSEWYGVNVRLSQLAPERWVKRSAHISGRQWTMERNHSI